MPHFRGDRKLDRARATELKKQPQNGYISFYGILLDANLFEEIAAELVPRNSGPAYIFGLPARTQPSCASMHSMLIIM